MRDQSLGGGFANPSHDAARTFRAALSVMARPGRIETAALAQAPGPVSPAAAALVLTLCDAETPLFLAPGHDGSAVRDWVAFHTGAPIVSPDKAQFALGGWAGLLPLSGYPQGTPEYPDRSTTLIVEVEAFAPHTHRLTGPGIEAEAHIALPDGAALRVNHAQFPRGLDFYFTAQDQLAGLPRTTRVEDL